MALLLSIIATVLSIWNTVLYLKNSKRSKRTEFLQRQDYLRLKISDLNAKTSESRLNVAKLKIVQLKMLASPVVDRAHREELNSLVASIEETRIEQETTANKWEENIENFYSICSTLTSKTDPAVIENLIAQVQIISDGIKQTNERYLASSHVLEAVDPLQRANVERFHELNSGQDEQDLKDLWQVFENLEVSIRKIKKVDPT